MAGFARCVGGGVPDAPLLALQFCCKAYRNVRCGAGTPSVMACGHASSFKEGAKGRGAIHSFPQHVHISQTQT